MSLKHLHKDARSINSREYKLKRNIVTCGYCGEDVESTHRHDFKWCSCGKTAADGGTFYQKITGDNWNTDNSVLEDQYGNQITRKEWRELYG